MVERPTSGWQKVSVASGAVAVVLIPVVLALLGTWTSTALKDREVRGQFVQLAVSILQQPPTPENRSVREWAIDVINKYSEVPLESAAEDSLKESAVLPRPSAAVGPAMDRTSAAVFEREAFSRLVAGDIDGAITAFEAAEAAYPSYHAVYDIAQLLRSNQARWDEPSARREVLRKIVTDYAWKAPADLLQELRQQAES